MTRFSSLQKRRRRIENATRGVVLPWEIILLIFSHADLATKIAMGLTCQTLNRELNKETLKVDLYDLLCSDRFLRSLNLSLFPRWIMKYFLRHADVTANASFQKIRPEKPITGSIFKGSGKELELEIVRKQPSDPVQIYVFKKNKVFISSLKKIDKKNFGVNLGHCTIYMKVEKNGTVVAKEYDNYDFDLSSPSFVITTKYRICERDELDFVEETMGYE